MADVEKLKSLLIEEGKDHNPLTQIEIGKIYQEGDVPGENPVSSWEKALFWFKKAEEQNCNDALYFIASCYDMDQEAAFRKPEKAFHFYVQACQKDVVPAFLELGRCYEDGYGVEKDEKMAYTLYRKAAARKFPFSFRFVAECLLFGRGVERNPDEAKVWFEKIIKNDYSAYGFFPTSDDYLFLGLCYKISPKSKGDQKKAFTNFTKSSEMENPNGINELGECYFYGTGVKEDNDKAFELFKKAAGLGNVFAYRNIGICYSKGFGTKENPEKAFGNFKKSFDMGNEQASIDIGVCYNQGNGVKEDPDKAFKYFSMAVKNKIPESYWWMGKAYEYGDGCKQDFKKAFHYYEKAMKNNDPRGIIALGECYMSGLGVGKDFDRGWGMIQSLADEGNPTAKEWMEENR